MKILFTSDLHGHYKAYSEFSRILKDGDYDLGIIAGDLMTHVPLDELSDGVNDYMKSIEHMIVEIKKILLSSGKHIFFIMGNDDGIIEGGIKWPNIGKLLNINQKKVKYKGYSFIGYQYTPPFLGGLYEKQEIEQLQDFKTLKSKIDDKTILVTHGPPAGVLDGQNYGSTALKALVKERMPLLHLFGHVHQSFGREGNSINGAFPTARKFVDINLTTLVSKGIEITI